MILSRRVSLAGVQLDSLSNAIVIRGVNCGVPHESVTAVSRMGGAGQRMTSQHWEYMEVAVTYAIDLPKRSLAARRQVFDAVNQWAMKKGWLTTNQMNGRRLYVDKTVFPSSGDMWNWTGEYTVTFRAYNVPFWQDDTAATASESGIASGSVSLTVGGNVESVLDATFKNTSGSTVDSVTIAVSGNALVFTDLGLANNETLTIAHGTDGILRAAIGGTNVIAKRSGSDDLYVEPGTRTVYIEAGGAGTLTISCCGRYT